MRDLILTALFLIPGLASAEWKLNPYTQRQDYYESKAAVVLSTGAIQAQVDALHVTTTTLTQDLATEVSRATVRENAIGASTGTLKTQIDAVAVSTGVNAAAISTLSASTTTLGGRILANEAWISTAQPRLDNLDAYSLSTGTVFGGDVSGTYDAIDIDSATYWNNALRSESDPVFTASEAYNITASSTADWNTAYGWGDHAGLYLVAPASFTYQTPLVAGTDYLAPDGDGSGLSGVIQSTATGQYALRVATATYLATAPGTCAAGEFINALTADGTKTCATPAGGGDVLAAGDTTFTGDNTFTGSVTVSSLTATGYVAGIHTSSTTDLTYQDKDYATGTFNTCVDGSTVTITTTGGRLLVGYAGILAVTNTDYEAYLTVLLNGVSVTGTDSITQMSSHNGALPQNGSFTYLIDDVAAGTHSLCLAARRGADAPYPLRLNFNSQKNRPRFWVVELR